MACILTTKSCILEHWIICMSAAFGLSWYDEMIDRDRATGEDTIEHTVLELRVFSSPIHVSSVITIVPIRFTALMQVLA